MLFLTSFSTIMCSMLELTYHSSTERERERERKVFRTRCIREILKQRRRERERDCAKMSERDDLSKCKRER